ncbi:MAG: hypothetical protein HKN15_00950, partial [Xanthomonadales bacterium]|nr:hypothetical protein [Xanthomonadales bacterium]
MASRKRKHSAGQRSLRWQDRTLLIIGITLLSLVLLRIETAQADEQDWGLELSSGGVRSVQMALNTDVKVEVSGLVARTEVTQVFSNPGDMWAEGIYRFPLPDGAAVDRMQIKVGDRIIEGEIQERKAAKRVYQQALKKGVTAALVEQQKVNQFETRLANIGPGEEVRVVIGFLMNVKFEEGSFSLRLPMTFTPRFDAPGGMALAVPVPHPSLVASGSRLDHLLNVEFLINTGIGFAAIESHYHDVEIEATSSGYRVALLNNFELTDRDFELSWHPDLHTVPQSSLMTWDGGDAIYAQLMVVPPLPGALDHQ